MRILIIANPIAGGGKGRDQATRLADTLHQRGHEAELFLTSAEGDARRRTRDHADLDLIVSVGGDGTLNEIINGLPEPDALPLAQLPMGTANIMARELHLPWAVSGLAALIDDPSYRRIDLGVLNGRRFLAVASCGIDAKVVHIIDRRRHGALGILGYPLPMLYAALWYRPATMQVTVDGQSCEGQQVVISSIRNYAGFFSIADRAECDDGLLDVVVFPRAGVPRMSLAMISALRKRVSKRGDVIYLTGRNIEVRCDSPVPVQVDGDAADTTPLEITTLRQAVRFLAPPAR